MKIRKCILAALSLAVLFVSGCSARQDGIEAGIARNDAPAGDASGKVLIIYFSNSGNTERVAHIIQEKTAGTLFEIKTIEEYPSHPEILDVAKKQLEEGYLPPLEGEFPRPETYEYIFAGSPVWWLNLPAPVLSFLSSFDFGGKKTVLFCTTKEGTGEYFARFAKEAKNAVIIGGKKIFRFVDSQKTEALEEDISSWLKTVFTDGGD
jgi:flavodoxin